MSGPAISVKNLSKVYRIGRRVESSQTFAGAISGFLMSPLHNLRRLRALSRFRPDELEAAGDVVWALKDVSFTVERGQVLGIIGHNGAGKSTLLKILSRITAPSSGRVVLDGRVSSLLEVGTGFHPELTGRENIYLNGTILGMARSEIDAKLEEIIDFSGVEKFIETPVKYYSSGMRVRLAFSVAAHLEPEILLVDEVLAVGDAEFQRKCLGKMGEVSRQGRTVLFISHDMVAVQALCGSVILLEDGMIRQRGLPEVVVGGYLARAGSETGADLRTYDRDREGSGSLRFTHWLMIDEQLGPGTQVRCNQPCEIRLGFETLNEAHLRNVSVSLTIKDIYGRPLLTFGTLFTGGDFDSVVNTGEFICSIDAMPLLPDAYKIHLWCSVGGETADRIVDAGTLNVVVSDAFDSGKLPRAGKHGFFLTKHSWQLENKVGQSTEMEIADGE